MVIILNEEGGVGHQIEILILQALCYQTLNIMDRALVSLGKAIQMGEAEGYYRIFIDEGEEFFKLLQNFKLNQEQLPLEKRSGKLIEYIDNLYKGFVKENKKVTEHDSDFSLQIIESLTRREWVVLKLLTEGFSNQAIAESLFISIATVKTHVQNIYRKLKVKSRAKAIALINKLNLLSTYNKLEG